MNGWMVAAGVLAALGAIAHGAGGERTSLRALRAGTPSEGDRLELRMGWHLYTWTLALLAAVMLLPELRVVESSVLLSWLPVGIFLGSGLIVLAFALKKGAALRHPQWTLLLLIGTLAWLARR